MSRIAVDFDGTLVTKAWPGMGEWLPGAITAMQNLNEAGHSVYLYSSRLNSVWPDNSPRDPVEVIQAVNEVREMLDNAGLSWMDIWPGIGGKPHWDLLIDDKAIWYPGRAKSWARLTPIILKKVGDEDSFAAVMEDAAVEDAREVLEDRPPTMPPASDDL